MTTKQAGCLRVIQAQGVPALVRCLSDSCASVSMAAYGALLAGAHFQCMREEFVGDADGDAVRRLLADMNTASDQQPRAIIAVQILAKLAHVRPAEQPASRKVGAAALVHVRTCHTPADAWQ